MLKDYFINIGIIFISILLQVTLIKLIAISPYNITPDIVFLSLIYISLKKGSMEGSAYGFFAGITVDVLSGSFVGLLSLIYSVICFIIGYFKTEDNRYLRKYNFFVISLIFSTLNLTIYYFIYFQGSSLSIIDLLVRYIIPTSAYTATFSLFYIFFFLKRNLRTGF